MENNKITKEDIRKMSTGNVLNIFRKSIEDGDAELSQKIQDIIIEEHGEKLFESIEELSKKQ
jgi:hypothetical protein